MFSSEETIGSIICDGSSPNTSASIADISKFSKVFTYCSSKPKSSISVKVVSVITLFISSILFAVFTSTTLSTASLRSSPSPTSGCGPNCDSAYWNWLLKLFS